jgi:hypothetical protein
VGLLAPDAETSIVTSPAVDERVTFDPALSDFITPLPAISEEPVPALDNDELKVVTSPMLATVTPDTPCTVLI